MKKEISLKGKTAIVTGGATGIGYAIASELLEEIQNRTPLRGFAKEKDLGMAATFLCSDAARFISGIDLVVDGGISSSFLL